MNNEKIQELKRLAKAATPGPWAWTESDGSNLAELYGANGPKDQICTFGDIENSYVQSAGMEPEPPDMAYIAAANPAVVLELIAMVEAGNPASVAAPAAAGTIAGSAEFLRLVKNYRAANPEDAMATGIELVAHIDQHVAAAVSEVTRERDAARASAEAFHKAACRAIAELAELKLRAATAPRSQAFAYAGKLVQEKMNKVSAGAPVSGAEPKSVEIGGIRIVEDATMPANTYAVRQPQGDENWYPPAGHLLIGPDLVRCAKGEGDLMFSNKKVMNFAQSCGIVLGNEARAAKQAGKQ